jgi:hypothetical protein
MLLRRLGWLVCVIYATIPSFWLVIHTRVAYWRSRRSSPYRLLTPLWIGMWLALGVITSPWRNVTLYSSVWTWIPAAFLFAIGLWIYQAFWKRIQRSPTRRPSRGHARTSRTAAIDVRHPRSRSPSRLPGTSVRDACVERWYRIDRLLWLDDACRDLGRDHDSTGR